MADEKVLRRDYRVSALGAQQAAGAGTTSITFAADPSLPTLAADEIVKLIIGTETEYLTTYTAAALTGTVIRAREGTTADLHANGAPVTVGPTKRDLSNGRLAAVSRAAGDLTLNSTAWGDVNTGLDLSLAWCFEHDLIEVGVAARILSGGPDLYLDAVTRPAAVNVNSIGLTPFGGTVVSAPTGVTTDEGIAGWTALGPDNARIGGSVFYRLTAADISGTTTTVIRLRYRTASAVNRTMKASTLAPLHAWVKNHGQQESLSI